MPTVSHSWNASLPIRCVGTCPVMHTSGMESISASVSGVTMLVAPGPDVTSTTTGCPFERARPRRPQHDAGLSGRARIALGGVTGALLVPHQDVLDFALLENLIVDRKHRAAGVAEDVLDPMIAPRAH